MYVPQQHKPLKLLEHQDFTSLPFDQCWGRRGAGNTNYCSLFLLVRFSLKTFLNMREFNTFSDPVFLAF